jgi:hypothetical protein
MLFLYSLAHERSTGPGGWLYGNGNIENDLNHGTESELYGKAPATP